MKFNTPEDVYRYLEKMPRFQSVGENAAKFDLNRFENFCKSIGNPQDDFPAVHVAGTNGKGSTCQILASIYGEAGYNVGLYTSPHLVDFRERFQVNARQITDSELLVFFQEHTEEITTSQLTYFEVSTAIAFWWFSTRQTDLSVIEVGLGGRLDATNVITPVLSVITNISLDHTGILGDTVRQIAREKAGIIKDEIPVVVGNVTSEAAEVIFETAKERASSLYDISLLNPKWESGGCILTEQGEEIRVQTDLIHPVQRYNIAVAWKVVTILQPRFPVPEQAVREGLAHVRRNYKSPGRFEKIHPEAEWYFDGAHNPEAVKAMLEMVSGMKSPGETVLVLSIMKDKINRSVIDEFQKFKKIYYYELEFERAATYNEIKNWLPDASAFPREGPQQKRFLKELETELVIFAGSFYFYQTVREWLQSSASVH